MEDERSGPVRTRSGSFFFKKKKKKDDGRFVAPLEDTKRERKREREGKEIKKIKK